MLTKEQIQAAQDRRTIDVEVPEWHGSIKLRVMSAGARDAYEMAVYRSRDKDAEANSLRARMVVACAVDEAGNPLFTEADMGWLSQKSASALDRLFVAARKLNAMDDEAVNEAEKS